jgi:hypothetical protein
MRIALLGASSRRAAGFGYVSSLSSLDGVLLDAETYLGLSS